MIAAGGWYGKTEWLQSKGVVVSATDAASPSPEMVQRSWADIEDMDREGNEVGAMGKNTMPRAAALQLAQLHGTSSAGGKAPRGRL